MTMRNESLTNIMPPVNPGEYHILVVLLVDKSVSMAGRSIEKINQMLVEFGKALNENTLVLGRTDVSVISFDDNVHTEVGFRPAAEYQAPCLSADGGAALNHGIQAALNAINARKKEYLAQGISYYRPWLFVMASGASTDLSCEDAASDRLRREIGNKRVIYLPMGMGPDPDAYRLRVYYPAGDFNKNILKEDIGIFSDIFVWLGSIPAHSFILSSRIDAGAGQEASLPFPSSIRRPSYPPVDPLAELPADFPETGWD